MLWLTAIGGGLLGFFVGRGTVANQSEALIALVDALSAQHRISTAAPTLAVGLSTLAAILGSTLSVTAVSWVLWRSERKESLYQ